MSPSSPATGSDVWADDRLARRNEAEHLQHFVIGEFQRRCDEGRNASYILNVDARWGEGKTFFLQRLAQQLQSDGHLVASINAWQDDLSGEPLTSIMSAITETLRPCTQARHRAGKFFKSATRKLGVVAFEASKQVASHAVKVATGISVQRLAEAAGAADADDKVATRTGDAGGEAASKIAQKLFERSISDHKATAEALIGFKTDLKTTLETITSASEAVKPPLFVLIDELDRCRPSYAIRLLEDAKHIFDVPGVVFIIATDSEQLAHSVRAIYGEGFEGRRYLRRFFDRVYVFPHNNRFDFARSLFERFGLEESQFSSPANLAPSELVASWIRAFAVSTRDAEQCFEVIATFTTSWPHPTRINLFFLLVYVWAFYARNDVEMRLFTDMMASRVHGTSLTNWRLEFTDAGSSKQVVTAEDILKLLFNAVSVAPAGRFDDSLWGPHLRSEFHDRGLWRPLREDSQSVLTEYPSRVWNSGRVIDRIPPP
jgi:hypothetical protein